MRALCRAIFADEAGGIAITFAIFLPIIALLGCGAVDLAAVAKTRSTAQASVDAAALAMAKQVGVTGAVGIEPRAQAFVAEQLVAPELTYQVTAVTDERTGSVTVTLVGNRPSFFMNLLPPGGWDLKAEATATAMGVMPLCVLSAGADAKNKVEFKEKGQLSAPGCLVHSNGSISIGGEARLAAGIVQASAEAKGPISPSAQVGAPEIEDPFATLSIRPDDQSCPVLPKMPKGGPKDTLPLIVPAATHCGDILVGKDQAVTLGAGEHYFKKGKLTVESNGVLRGNDVVLIFDKESDFVFKDKASISLEGRKSGTFEGFVLMTTRENDRTFDISSDSANKFLGTIYVPSATLLVRGAGNKVADASDWTVIVAKAIKLEGSPKLVINSKYAGSAVPVPQGVGNNTAVKLAK